jgi:hypothetical protein
LIRVIRIQEGLGAAIVGIVVLMAIAVIRNRNLILRCSGCPAPRATEHWFVTELLVRGNGTCGGNSGQSLPLSSPTHSHEETEEKSEKES